LSLALDPETRDAFGKIPENSRTFLTLDRRNGNKWVERRSVSEFTGGKYGGSINYIYKL